MEYIQPPMRQYITLDYKLDALQYYLDQDKSTLQYDNLYKKFYSHCFFDPEHI